MGIAQNLGSSLLGLDRRATGADADRARLGLAQRVLPRRAAGA